MACVRPGAASRSTRAAQPHPPCPRLQVGRPRTPPPGVPQSGNWNLRPSLCTSHSACLSRVSAHQCPLGHYEVPAGRRGWRRACHVVSVPCFPIDCPAALKVQAGLGCAVAPSRHLVASSKKTAHRWNRVSHTTSHADPTATPRLQAMLLVRSHSDTDGTTLSMSMCISRGPSAWLQNESQIRTGASY